MLTPDDLIILPYSPDLTQAGVAYACRSLLHAYPRKTGSSYDRLRDIVAAKAVELAFRRYLTGRAVPFDSIGSAPFSEPERCDVLLGGRRCDLISFSISQREKIRRVRSSPGALLEAPALVPLDRMASENQSEEDLYIFAFVTGLTTRHSSEVKRARLAKQPIAMIHPLPAVWNAASRWTLLGELALKSEASRPMHVELGGQTENRLFMSVEVSLPPRQRVQIDNCFYSLGYLTTGDIPGGRIGIHSPTLQHSHIIQPHEWGNLWLYGMDVVLVGYITRGEYRRRAELLPVGSRVFQFPHTRLKNLALPAGCLHPISDLLERVREWEGRKRDPEI